MSAINDQTRGAVKLTRADAVKIVAGEMAAQAAADADGAAVVVADAQRGFRAAVCARAEAIHEDVLRGMLGACSGDVVHTVTPFQLGDESVQVTFSDHPRPYEARMKLIVFMALSDSERALMDQWQRAVDAAARAETRDQRMSAMSKEAREALIKSALDATPEGQDVIAAIRALSIALRHATN